MKTPSQHITKLLRKRKSFGFVAVVTVLAMPVVLMIAGLAIDSGRTYLVKSRLLAAVDAASIAAARAVANGESAATDAANRYFNVNFPSDFHDAVPTLGTINYTNDDNGNISIDVNATAEVSNTLFLSLFGYQTTEIAVNAQSIRRPVDIAFVVDNTTSLRYGSIGDVTEDVVERSKDFVSNFHESFDRVALVKFAYGAEVPVPFESTRGHSRSDLLTEIDAFDFGGSGNVQYTNASEGMYQALDALRNVENPASLKVIVFFTDGAPNTFASTFDLRFTSTDYTGSLRSGDSTSGGTPRGLYRHDQISQTLSWPAWRSYDIDDYLASLPDFYTAHDSDAEEFKVLNPDHPVRPVSQYYYYSHSASDLYRRVNRVARNLVEDMAQVARQENIYVFTLGLGSSLTSATGPDSEQGQDLLLRMANDPTMLEDADLAGDFAANELQGVYCHAVDEFALGPCFDQMLDVIIRLTL